MRTRPDPVKDCPVTEPSTGEGLPALLHELDEALPDRRPDLREAATLRAARALADRILAESADPEQLYAGGWERGHEDRWQLLLQRRAS